MSNQNQNKKKLGLFNQRPLDLDIPNFNPTKYNNVYWRICHGTAYLSFGILYFLSWSFITSGIVIRKKAFFMGSINLVIGSFFYSLSTFIEWLHFRRGCIGMSNLNSMMKNNIDKSCGAAMVRSLTGRNYFLSFFASLILSGNSIAYLIITIKKEPSKPFDFFYHFQLMGFIIIVLAQILKIDKITQKTKQYNYKNDYSNLLVEMTLLIGGLIFCIGTIMIITYYNRAFPHFCLIAGTLFFIISGFIIEYRYFLSGFADLNGSESTYITV